MFYLVEKLVFLKGASNFGPFDHFGFFILKFKLIGKF